MWPWLLACSSVAPDPATASADNLPKVQLSAAQLDACSQWENEAVDAVVDRRYGQAEDAANRVLADNPRSAKARAVLGMVKLQRAAQEKPIDWFGQRAGEVELELARQLAPASAFVGWMHAAFLAETGHISAAAEAAEDALVRSAAAPASERAALLGTAGTYRYELGEERAALPHLQAYVALRPDDAMAQFRLGASLLSISKTPQGSPVPYSKAQSDAEAAAAAFARCYQLLPQDEDAALSMATAWLRAAEVAGIQKHPGERDALYVKASAHLKELAARFPASPEVHFRLGVLAALQQQPLVAQAAYVAALERDPGHVGSLMNLASQLVKQGNLQVAKETLVSLLALPAAQNELSRDERQRIERWLKELADRAASKEPASAGG